MINLESTEFRAIKSIVRNVEAIYDDMGKCPEILSLGELEEAITTSLENISRNVYPLLDRKSLKSYETKKGVDDATIFNMSKR